MKKSSKNIFIVLLKVMWVILCVVFNALFYGVTVALGAYNTSANYMAGQAFAKGTKNWYQNL
jgi:hypothetical protein